MAIVAEGGRVDAQAAINAARQTFERSEWRSKSSADRAGLVRKLAAAVREHADELARLETLDTGKTLAESAWDMSDIADVFDYYAELGEQDCDQPLTSPNPDSEQYTSP